MCGDDLMIELGQRAILATALNTKVLCLINRESIKLKQE